VEEERGREEDEERVASKGTFGLCLRKRLFALTSEVCCKSRPRRERRDTRMPLRNVESRG
jgi:hypothetical protein